jgi:multiple sugar transport system permease protein
MSLTHRTSAAPPAPLERRQKPRFLKDTRLPFAIPGVALYAILVLVPLILSLYFSFTNRNLLYGNENFVGIDNYVTLLTDSTFLGAFGFTAMLTAVTFVAVNLFSLAIAVLLDRVGRFFFAMRTLFFIPVALSGVIVAFIWSTILADKGLLNSTLNAVGLSHFAISWLGTPLAAQASVIGVTTWQAMGLCVVVYLAGLQTIPRELLDASRIDGCGHIGTFRSVTWPLLAPSVTINSTLLLINGFKAYDIPVVLTGTGPAGTTSTVATEVIRVGFNLDRAGLASAMAIIMLVTVAVVTGIVVLVLQRREVSG